METDIDVLIIGAGVVGLACARAFAQRRHEVVVVERHAQIGQETSSRNSGVIHSGIYYPTGSLKARFCVRGREQLYDYCLEKGIAHQRCGKLIVAQQAQLIQLRALEQKALANGVGDLRWLDPTEAAELEPTVRCAGALFSPSTGIVDTHELMLSLQGDAEQGGATVVFNTEVIAAHPQDNRTVVTLRDTDGTGELSCRRLINCAGLHAVPFLKTIAGYPNDRIPDAHYAKGNYFSLSGARPFKHLVYPMPNEAGLGVHATLDLDGTTRFGPDVEWIDVFDYRVDPHRGDAFYREIREYWPDLQDGALQPAYAGIRPKLVGPDAKASDFVIDGPTAHRIRGLVNLLGIESPGLTSSLAIAEFVAGCV